jgi:hypothetical protein
MEKMLEIKIMEKFKMKMLLKKISNNLNKKINLKIKIKIKKYKKINKWRIRMKIMIYLNFPEVYLQKLLMVNLKQKDRKVN